MLMQLVMIGSARGTIRRTSIYSYLGQLMYVGIGVSSFFPRQPFKYKRSSVPWYI